MGNIFDNQRSWSYWACVITEQLDIIVLYTQASGLNCIEFSVCDSYIVIRGGDLLCTVIDIVNLLCLLHGF